jgi:hypothetical protein
MKTCKRKMMRSYIIAPALLVIFMMISVMMPVSAYAIIDNCRFLGPITVDGLSVDPDSTMIKAWIDGSSSGPWEENVQEGEIYIAEGQIYTQYVKGSTYYLINVPPDDPATPVKDGGAKGDIVHFSVKVGDKIIPGPDHEWINKLIELHLHLMSPIIPEITTKALDDGTVGLNYVFNMNASNGTPPYTWTATGQPGGVSFSQGGAFNGKPVPAEADYSKFPITGNAATDNVAQYPITFTLKDAANQEATNPVILTMKLKWVIGDADGDGSVTMMDVVYVEQAILKKKPVTPGCDYDRNGQVNMLDVAWIELYILNQP